MKLKLISLIMILLVISLPIAFADTLSYDGNGNLVTGDGFYREYNSFNNLVTIRDGNSASGVVIEKLEWHPLEDRVLVKHVYNESGVWQETITYISESFVRVKNASGEFDTTYAIQNGQKIAQKNDDGSKYFSHADHLGSVGLITQDNGSVVEETIYSAFGEIISGGSTSLYDYEGKEFDSVTENYDFNARRYNPSWGLFEQPDPIIQNIYDPQTLNHYAFERNNPDKYVDPSGNVWWIPFLIVGGFAAAYVMSSRQEAKSQIRQHGDVVDQKGVVDQGFRGFFNSVIGYSAGQFVKGGGSLVEGATDTAVDKALDTEEVEDFLYEDIKKEDLDIAQSIIGVEYDMSFEDYNIIYANLAEAPKDESKEKSSSGSSGGGRSSYRYSKNSVINRDTGQEVPFYDLTPLYGDD